MVPVRAFYARKHEEGGCQRRSYAGSLPFGRTGSRPPQTSCPLSESPSRGATIGLKSPRMQDCYAFDVGDFGKLGLLRHIHRVTNLRFGVLWWRTTLGTTGSDGKYVAYLQNPALRACDPDLWEEMRQRFNPDARTIAALHPLLPADTLFHNTPVPAHARRSRWLDEAVSSVQASAVVFCDPDNGLTFDEPCRSLRHIGVDEIRSLYSGGNRLSCITRLIVRHHTPSKSRPSLSVFARPSPTLEARGRPASAVAAAGYSSCWRSERTEPPSMARWFRCGRRRGCTAVISRSCPAPRRVEAHGQHRAMTGSPDSPRSRLQSMQAGHRSLSACAGQGTDGILRPSRALHGRRLRLDRATVCASSSTTTAASTSPRIPGLQRSSARVT